MRICSFLLIAVMALTYKSHSVIIITDLKVSFNKTLTNISYVLVNDGVHPTLLHITMDYFFEIVKARLICSINCPENERDRGYKRQYFKTSLDFGKIFKGVFGNSITEKIGRSFLKETKITMPVKEGRYVVYNFSLPDIILPFGLPSRAYLHCLIDGKTKGEKKSVHGSTWEYFVKRI
ncbi:CLUMA_CG002900, isoform A [Clunio marinus]|uniref:CLUMA_CG002900, isoform A n=1 Tax=Clunio marinus TaxID=568069 RepID=A0A1J1HMH5_9DIPT|nr:CLUMA_CG002900, isoform A [Clunio marinus]